MLVGWVACLVEDPGFREEVGAEDGLGGEGGEGVVIEFTGGEFDFRRSANNCQMGNMHYLGVGFIKRVLYI